MQPRLTILMPAYNAAPYISEAIESLLNQTFGDFELWIIDDGSSDETRKRIDSFDDIRIKKIYFDHNKGRNGVINQLVEKVTSEFITVTDADDVSHPKRLQHQLDLFDSDTDLMMCGTSYYAISAHGIILRKMILSGNYTTIYSSILERPQFHGPTTVMRMSAIRALKEFYRTDFSDARADVDLASRLVDKFKAINLIEPLYFYRILPTSLSRNNYTTEYARVDQLISFMSKERRATGTDSLMRGDSEKMNEYKANLSNRFMNDPSLLYQQAAFYNLYWKMNGLAVKYAWTAFIKRPFRLKSIFLLLYVLTKSCLNELSVKLFGMNYKNIDKALN